MFESIAKLISTDSISRTHEKHTLGTLVKSISVDQASDRPSGPFDPIEGRVRLKYIAPKPKEGRNEAPAVEELVGPLEVKLVLDGCLVVKLSGYCDQCYIRHDAQYHGGFKRHKMEKQIVHLRNSPIRIQDRATLDLEFETFYPGGPQPRGIALADRVPQESAPPPSFNYIVHHGQDRNAAVMEYRLTAVIDIPLAVSVTGEFKEFRRAFFADEARSLLLQTHGTEAVKKIESDGGLARQTPPPAQYSRYSQPAPVSLPVALATESQSFLQTMSVSSWDLVSDQQQAQSLKLTLRGSKPVYVFHIACDKVPKHLSVGSPIQFQITVRPDTAASTVSDTLPIELNSFTLAMARQGEHRIIRSPSDVCRLNSTITPTGSFSSTNGWSKSFTTSPVTFAEVDRPISSCELRESRNPG
ncbi:unnamed protein product [Zymoseptoria tritici ST99CH_3D7]|uniref:Uncharacterized protein n=1 Tax=Zymoseptoria tritici (strain ST99CH_3D7) TaxID=1276538 RepID=A0A1X7S8H8_ZYMT9|nr:unnamed protein product [Zymoseptoria tritici ST99CH_3D7]